MSDEDWEREKRQRALIASVLDQYREGKSSLRRLAEDLYMLAQEIRLASDEWVDELQAEANSLEVMYAIALDRGFADNLPDRYLRDVDEAVERVANMLAELNDSPNAVFRDGD